MYAEEPDKTLGPSLGTRLLSSLNCEESIKVTAPQNSYDNEWGAHLFDKQKINLEIVKAIEFEIKCSADVE